MRYTFQVFDIQVRQRVNLRVLRCELGDEGELRLGLAEHACDELRGAANIERHRDRAQTQATEERDHPLRPVRRPDYHPVALGNAPTVQVSRHFGGDFPKLAVAPAAHPNARLDE